MKKLALTFPILVCTAWLCGCASVRHQAAEDTATGTLVIRLTSLYGMEGSYRDARIYVDRRFVGNYEPDDTELVLTTGTHRVEIRVPRVYSRELLPNNATQVRQYALRGEERIEVLGGGSKQNLVFNDMNLNLEEIEDQDEP